MLYCTALFLTQFSTQTKEPIMAKGMQSQKMVKKPKKDTSPAKVVSSTSEPMRPVVMTQVALKGKAAKAPKV
jgi:hypothetical protein